MPCHATQCNACMSKCVYMCVLAAAKYVLNGPERSRRPACFVVMWFCEMADGRLGYKLFLASMLLCTCGFPDEHIVGRRWEMLSCKERCLQMFAVIWNMCFHAPPCFGPNAVGTDYCTMQMWYDGLTTNYRLAKCALYALCTFVVLLHVALNPSQFLQVGPTSQASPHPIINSPLAETDMRNTCAKMINKELVDAGEQNSTWQQLARPSGGVQFGSTVGTLAPSSRLPVTKVWWFWKWWADTGLQQKSGRSLGGAVPGRTDVWSWLNFRPFPGRKC